MNKKLILILLVTLLIMALLKELNISPESLVKMMESLNDSKSDIVKRMKEREAEILRIQKIKDAEIAELRRRNEQLEEEKKLAKKKELKQKIKEFVLDGGLFFSQPIPARSCIENGTEFVMKLSKVVMPEGDFKTKVYIHPAVHECEDCKKVTKHVWFGCNLPVDYYYDETTLSKPIKVREEHLKCLECLFAYEGVSYLSDLKI